MHSTNQGPFLDRRLQRALLAALLLAPLASCAATAADTSTDVRFMVAGVRVDPPRAGQNSVYVEFQDQTAQGGAFEDEIYDGIIDAVEDRGYVFTDDFYEADYVLWASLRLFTEAGTKEADKALVALGGIAGGLATAGVIDAAGGSPTATWVGGVAGGGLFAAGTKWALQEKAWMMVCDLQLGKKVEGGVETTTRNEEERELAQRTIAGDGLSTEGGGSRSESERRQEYVEQRVHAEMQQRVLAHATGRRLGKDVARDSLAEKLVDGIKSAMPRGPRSRPTGR